MGEKPVRINLLSCYFVSEKQRLKGCRGLTVEIPLTSITVGEFFENICKGLKLRCISRHGAILKLKGTIISENERVTIFRDNDQIKVEGDFEQLEGVKFPGEQHNEGGKSSSSFFSDSECKMNNSASTAASVCSPSGQLDDAVDSFSGPKVEYPFRKSTGHNSDSMFNVNDFLGSSSWASKEPVVTVASGSSGLKALLDDTLKKKEMGLIRYLIDSKTSQFLCGIF